MQQTYLGMPPPTVADFVTSQQPIIATCVNGTAYNPCYKNGAALIGHVKLPEFVEQTGSLNETYQEEIKAWSQLGNHPKLTALEIPASCQTLYGGFVSSAQNGSPNLKSVYIHAYNLDHDGGSLGITVDGIPVITVYLPTGTKVLSLQYDDNEGWYTTELSEAGSVWTYYPDKLCQVYLGYWDPPSA